MGSERTVGSEHFKLSNSNKEGATGSGKKWKQPMWSHWKGCSSSPPSSGIEQEGCGTIFLRENQSTHTCLMELENAVSSVIPEYPIKARLGSDHAWCWLNGSGGGLGILGSWVQIPLGYWINTRWGLTQPVILPRSAKRVPACWYTVSEWWPVQGCVQQPRRLLRQRQRSAQSMVPMDGWMGSSPFESWG